LMVGPSELLSELGESRGLLRRAREILDPSRTYRMRLPDGRVVEVTRADVIAAADAAVALHDAVDRRRADRDLEGRLPSAMGILDLEIGRDDPRLLAQFDGLRPEWHVVELGANRDSGGRILVLRNGAAINQVRDGGRWKCIAFIGPDPEA